MTKELLTNKQKIEALEHAKDSVLESSDNAICPPIMRWLSNKLRVIIPSKEVPDKAVPELKEQIPESPYRMRNKKPLLWWAKDSDGQQERIKAIDRTIQKIKEYETNEERG